MNTRTRRRNRGLRWGLTAVSLVATLLGWKSFAGAGPQAGAPSVEAPSAVSSAPAPDPAQYVRMAVVTGPNGQLYLVPLAAGSGSAPAPIVRTQSSR
ncbi:MAG TPA: hypothetical protein VKT83_05035 [bacterium]|nr:hypothetical protein [bacterium]